MRNISFLILSILIGHLGKSTGFAAPIPSASHIPSPTSSSFQAWDQPATLLIRITGTNPNAAIEPRLWDTPPKQDPDIAICLSDQFSQSICIPEGNTYQVIQSSLCEDSQICVIPTIWLPATPFSIAVVDVDLQFNDLIGTGTCQVGNICSIGRAQVEVRSLESPTITGPDIIRRHSPIPSASLAQNHPLSINSIPDPNLDTPGTKESELSKLASDPELIDKPNEELSDAREITRILRENYSGWLDTLDPCPCTVAEVRNNPRFRDTTNEYFYIYGVRYLQKHHPGADYDFRSTQSAVGVYRSPINDRLPSLRPGQQCTYDAAGFLITTGPSAGTPDAYSPEIDPIASHSIKSNSHFFWDVSPLNASGMTWQEYHQTWIPNNGFLCPRNDDSPVTRTDEENIETNPSLSPVDDILW